jgi:glycosyltransferase involved in cell wall biosynthesis
MKVGIFLKNQLSELGGAYTFESEIFRALIEFGVQSNHIFILYCDDDSLASKLGSIQHIKIISPAQQFKESLISKLSRYTRAFIKKIQDPQSQLRIESRFDKFARKSVLQDGIDITWSFDQSCPELEVPYITTLWDLQHRLQPYFPEVSSGKQWQEREKNFSTILKRATFVLTGTETGKSEATHFYQVHPNKVRVLPFPTPKFALEIASHSSTNQIEDCAKILEKYQLPPQYLFYPAQFWPHKNHVCLLLAVKYLQDRYSLVFPTVFVGSDKGNQPYIKQLVDELNLSSHVYFLGFVPQPDLVLLYQNAFALTFPTFFGPDNLPPLEAFALGCPVIASDVPGAREQLGDNALLFDPANEEQLAIALKSLYDNPDLRQALIQRGLARALAWTGREYVREVLSILNEFTSIRRCWNN